MQKKISVVWTVIICLIVALLTFELTFVLTTFSAKKAERALAEAYQNNLTQIEQQFTSINDMYEALPDSQKNSELFKKLSLIDTYYRSLYVGQIDEERLSYYLMTGYIAGIGDKYGEYYTASDIDSIFNQAEGKMYGIGVNVIYNEEHDAIEIISLVPDSPAEKAGILPSDIIISVNGVRANADNYYMAINEVKGEKGTYVDLVILRNGTEISLSVMRDEIKIVTVSSRRYSLDTSIGVIRITEFNNTTGIQLADAIDSLTSQGCTSIVFDLRNNPGGTLDGVVESLDYILPEGNICFVRNAYGQLTQTLKSNAQCIDPSIKLAVLVNENTASAAELFAASIRDYNRGVIVGKTTFGKGTMQTTYMLPDGAGLKLSTNKYNPPCDVNYDGIGVAPHKDVDLDEAVKNKNIFKLTDLEDNQLLEACRELGYNN